jgi:CheY-like chemotaxis protein/HPt (histidine-containing phosphotransfer) domain-containing protein
MIPLRVLHVDDEPDIREIVELSLGLDHDLSVHSCASGGEALRAASDWPPDLILLDVMMPGMDGPATLARLRGAPQTADIPVVFMTARAQTRELEHFRSLGAAGVIAKPFDPLTLAGIVRHYAPAAEARRAVLRDSFIARARANMPALTDLRPDLADEANAALALDGVGAIAHALAGSAGIFGFHGIGIDAAALEDAVAMARAGNGSLDEVAHTLDCLVARIEADLDTGEPGNGRRRHAAGASDNGASGAGDANNAEPVRGRLAASPAHE